MVLQDSLQLWMFKKTLKPWSLPSELSSVFHFLKPFDRSDVIIVATGVGKTSLATALAETWLGSRRALVRVDTWPWRIIAQRFLVLDMSHCVSLVLFSFHPVQSVSCELSKMFEDEEFRTVQAQAVQSKQEVHLQQRWDVDHTQLCLVQVSYGWSSLRLPCAVLFFGGLAILCFVSTPYRRM